MKPVIGQCKLCLKTGVELRDSHFLSAGIYRILRDDNEKNPNPWLLTKDAAVQTSSQLKAHLLCHDCEQLFSKNGETWVLGRCRRKDGRFPLANVLAARNPDIASAGNPTRIYYAANIPEIKVGALAYFAASIFWRGSIHPWNEDGSIPVRLGPFQERFRRFLMGEEAFPKDSILWVVVRDAGGVDRLTYAPMGERKGNFHVYKFPMPGFGFSLTVSKNIPDHYRQRCLVYGPGNPIIASSLLEDLLMNDAVKMRQSSFSRVPA
jgi:hypothetical protein